MLVGRDPELTRVEALLEGARAGRGGTLVLTGPPGIGKSAILDAVAARAGTLQTVRVTGVQAERDVPYAGLHAMLGPLVRAEVLETLPEPQAKGLAVALGRSAGDPPGRLVLGAATLGVLGGQRGVVLLVDDLQWLDAPSADALCFAARRLVAEPVAVVATVRTDHPLESSSPAAGLPTLPLAGLADATALLPHVHPTVARALVRATAGNPLAVIESAAGLTPEEAAGLIPLPRQLPPSNPERVYADRLASLPEAARAAARLVALAGRAPAQVLDRALADTGLRPDDLAPLESLGLCRVKPVPTWRHPLARSAAARGPRPEVRAAHGALAAAWGEHAGAARAWHLAEAADGTDAAAAAALERAADEAERLDASADAADAWERAARLAPSPRDRVRLLESAASAALRAGSTRRSSALLDEALQAQPGPDAAARLLRQRGRIEHTLGNPARSLDLFLQAVDIASDPGQRVWAAAEGLHSAMYAGRPDQATRMAELARHHHDPADPVQRFLVAHAHGAAASLRHDLDEARTAMDRARTLLETGLLRQQPDLALWAVNVELFDPVGQALPADLVAVLDRMRSAGDLTWLPRVTRLVALRHLAAGRWVEGQRWLDEAEITSRMSGQGTQLAEALLQLAGLDAVQGSSDRCRARLGEAATLLADLGVSWLEPGVQWVAGLDLLTQGKPVEAAAAFEEAAGDPDSVLLRVELVLRVSGPAAAGAVIESAAGLPEQVRGVAEALVHPDESTGARALASRADELLAVDEAICRTFAGERYRRAGDRVLAREQLRAAHTIFTGLDADPWVRRVEDELRASGATLRRGPEGAGLTPSERRVATMVADGLSNKEVAAALYLSPKTVEFHLGRVYRKLGVANRTALARTLRA